MKTAIINTTLVMPDHLIPGATLICEDGRILDFGKGLSTEGCDVYDAEGAYTGPGLLDIHTHAADLTRFYNDPYHAADFLLAHGVTDVLAATSYSRTAETIVNDIKIIKEAINSPDKAKNLIGIYMEGPYLNVNFGANKVNHPWAPTVALERFKAVVDEAIDVTYMWAIAPERENIDEYVDYIRSKNPNARFAVGHSEAEPWQIERLIPKGLCDVTHHTNATGTLQNYPECRTACVDETAHYNDSLYTELICDKICSLIVNDLIYVSHYTKHHKLLDNFGSSDLEARCEFTHRYFIRYIYAKLLLSCFFKLRLHLLFFLCGAAVLSLMRSFRTLIIILIILGKLLLFTKRIASSVIMCNVVVKLFIVL